jgi:predicted HTH transcriptional regulator
MNCKGGIIFIGIMENKDRKNEVVGIQLKPTDVKPITDLFYG